MKVLLVSSTGGHFNALQKLSPFWSQHDSCWVTFRTRSTESILQSQRVYWAYGPTNRSIVNLIRNFVLTFKVLFVERPDLILSTGAGVSVPIIILGKIFGCRTIFVESFTRVKELSLSARLILPFLDQIYVYWRELKDKYPQAEILEISA